MWSPTHVQVTVQRAKGLLTKGKNGTNNCFVTIGLGKEKYQTSVKEKSETNVNWNEECELKIPDQGNRAELVLTCLHRNNLGIDEFLGQVTLPLNEMDVYDRPRSKWHKLESKPGKEKKSKERGELEVRVSFIVKSGSLTDLSKKDKHKSSIGQLASSVGGSLLSIGQIEKRKGIKKFAKSLGSKMHLNGKKKNKDGGDDASSFSGSFASIGTPNGSNGGSRRYGQRAGEADPGVISEDEDEFVFDNLSHKSSGSSLNIRSGVHHSPHSNHPTQPPHAQLQLPHQQQSPQQQLQQPQQSHSYVPQNPSPLLGLSGKAAGKQQQQSERHPPEDADVAVDPELQEIAHDISVRTLPPPPTKPPRTPQLSMDSQGAGPAAAAAEPKMDEWESKLYGAGQHLQVGMSDSLKRRSWERVPLPASNEVAAQKEGEKREEMTKKEPEASSDDSSSSSSSEDEEYEAPAPLPPATEPPKQAPASPTPESSSPKETSASILRPRINLLTPEKESKDFDEYNASFAKFEQRNSSKIFDFDAEDQKWGIGDSSEAFIASEAAPQPQPRPRSQTQKENDMAAALKKQQQEEEEQRVRAAEAEERRLEAERQRRRAEEDARLEAELRLNEQRLRDEELALELELQQRRDEEQRRREAKRLEEDQRILNFVKRSSSLEDESPDALSTPEQSPKELVAREKRLGKYKFKRAVERSDSGEKPAMPKSTERIIIGHEKSLTHAERRSEITAALTKKYEGKSREELMLIANGMENEALLQRQRVKELEDYLDNLLLRVMETHPKILQNPYSRTTSAKSG